MPIYPGILKSDSYHSHRLTPIALMHIYCLQLLLLMLFLPASLAALEIPEPLQPWVPWVLHGQEEALCTEAPGLARRLCNWPGALALEVDSGGAAFQQQWHLQKKGWIALPGDAKTWPQAVSLDGKAALLVDRDGVPAVFVDAPGTYTVKGRLLWEKMPKSLRLPAGTGLVAPFTIAGQQRAADLRDNLLWLSRPEGEEQEAAEVRLQVYRLIEDGIPVKVTSHLDLQISGKPREIKVDWPLPRDQVALELKSNLPVRVGTDNALHIQARPGDFWIRYTSRPTGKVERLVLADSEQGPAGEYWSFAANNQLRVVKIEGDAVAVDPGRTEIPRQWQQYPAYRMEKGQTMVFTTLKRGNPEPPPNQLTLHRSIWLDGSGSGMTIQDNLSGTVHRQPRLEMQAPAELGRMVVNGRDQLITRLSPEGPTGVEVRQGDIEALAVSRLEGERSFAAAGWGQTIQKLEATLVLPPGWKLLHVRGVDSARTWISQWTLLDSFVVLIIVISTFKLLGLRAGVISLVGLALTYHDPAAPVFLWLVLLGCIGILRSMPAAAFTRMVERARTAVLLLLVVLLLPYAVEQLRIGFFPQLEYPSHHLSSFREDTESMAEGAPQPALEKRVYSQMYKGSSLQGETIGAAEQYADKLAPEYDVQSKLQAGPGIPQHRWQVIPLRWNGPVDENLRLTLVLVPPVVNLLLAFVKVIALFLLAWCMLDRRGRGRPSRRPTSAAAVVAMVVLLTSVVAVPPGHCGQFPDSEMLDSLRARLLESPPCSPNCADYEGMEITIRGTTMDLEILANSTATTAVRLPNGEEIHWRQILLNEEPAAVLAQEGELFLQLPAGRHRLRLSGLLAASDVQLNMPRRPHRVSFDGGSQWSVQGLDGNGVPAGRLQFLRTGPGSAAEDFTTTSLPPLMQVERILHLGLQWRVETVVRRLSPPGTAVYLSIPLLQGESLTNADFETRQGAVEVRFAAEEMEKRWLSVFAIHSPVVLQAPDTTKWYEVWRLDASPTWHLQADGLAPIVHHASTGRWQPEWRPWQNERLRLAVTRPEGVPGPTKAIDFSQLEISPGLRSSSMRLSLAIRSTRGDQQQITLPEQAVIQSVTLDGRRQPVKDERTVILPLTPGSQQAVIDWQTPAGISTFFQVPTVDVGGPSVNSSIEIKTGQRWVWFVSGPRFGPAILFYSELLIILLVAIALGRLRITPLRGYHWFILGCGLSQSGLVPALIIVAWFIVLWARQRYAERLSRWFNLAQVLLVLLTVIAAAALLYAIRTGLLGHPDMLISGNDSSSYLLRWYQDRVVAGILPRPVVVSVPMFVYRIVMLLWALWLAFHLLRWIRWGWGCFTSGPGWRSLLRNNNHEPAETEPSGQ